MKRTNRVAWGLVVVLAAMLASGGRMFVSYQNRLTDRDRWVRLLPMGAWGLGPDNEIATINAIVRQLGGDAGNWWPMRYKMGFVTVRVERSPRPLAPTASTRSGTVR